MESRHGVYILVNSETKGIVKIGMTTRHVDDRIAELHGTGTIGRFSCVGFVRTDGNPEILERKLHSAFRANRVNNEFFRVSPETVIKKALELMEPGDTVTLSPTDIKQAQSILEYNRRYAKQKKELDERVAARKAKIQAEKDREEQEAIEFSREAQRDMDFELFVGRALCVLLAVPTMG